MQLDDIVADVHRQLSSVAALGDERTKEVADAVATAAEPVVRLAVLRAVTLAAEEATAGLLDFPGAPSVTAALDDDRVRIDVRATAAPPAEPPPAPADDTDASARISLRLPEQLKAQIETAAAHEGTSVNSFIVATLARTLGLGRRGASGTFSPSGGSHHLNGWTHG